MSNHRTNDYQHNLKGKNPARGNDEGIKVKYISNPVMVKANNASEFRAIVQGLTGRNSVIQSPGYAKTSNKASSRVHHNHGTSKPVVENGVYEYLDTVSSLQLNEDLFWGEVSESFSSLQFPRQ